MTEPPLRFCRRLFRVSLITLPYLLFASLAGLLVVLVVLLRKLKPPYLDPLTSGSLLLVSLLMLVSTLTATNRGEAALQLANFLPFFLLFAVLPSLLRGLEQMEQTAADLVLATLPINLVAIAEYVLKSPYLPAAAQQWRWVEWIRAAPHKGRAMVMFDHPNALASYLVVIFGLGLGLVLSHLRRWPTAAQHKSPSSLPPSTPHASHPTRSIPTWLLYTGTFLNLVGIFCTGSRNGLAIAISQLILFCFYTRLNWKVVVASLVGVGAIAVGALSIGLGVRRLGVINVADDPRLGIWKIALDLIQERPWLGWGLGNFKFLYPPRLIDPTYPDIFHTHNLWLLLGVETGLVVMVLLTVTVSFVCYRGVRSLSSTPLTSSQRSIAIGYFLALWGSVGYSLFDITLYDARINVVNWVVLAGIYALSQPYGSTSSGGPSHLGSQIK